MLFHTESPGQAGALSHGALTMLLETLMSFKAFPRTQLCTRSSSNKHSFIHSFGRLEKPPGGSGFKLRGGGFWRIRALHVSWRIRARTSCAASRKDSGSSRYSTSPRNGNRVNGNHLDQSLSSSEKWELSYLGPGGLDSVFYIPCTESLVRISSWRVGIVSHR